MLSPILLETSAKRFADRSDADAIGSLRRLAEDMREYENEPFIFREPELAVAYLEDIAVRMEARMKPDQMVTSGVRFLRPSLEKVK